MYMQIVALVNPTVHSDLLGVVVPSTRTRYSTP
jgi:hypothetical protein